MAKRRMFALSVTNADDFIAMPVSAQALYFHLGMLADDDGMINCAIKTQRSIGATPEDLQLLVDKGYLIRFDSGVYAITHWHQSNKIQKDRRSSTVFIAEKKQLHLRDDDCYERVDPECIQNVSKPDPQVSLGKDSLGKDSLGKGSVVDVSEDCATTTTDVPPINHILSSDLDMIKKTWNAQSFVNPIRTLQPDTKRYAAVLHAVQHFSLKDVISTISSISDQGYFRKYAADGKKIRFDWFFDKDTFTKIVEGAYMQDYVEQKGGSGQNEPDRREVWVSTSLDDSGMLVHQSTPDGPVCKKTLSKSNSGYMDADGYTYDFASEGDM